MHRQSFKVHNSISTAFVIRKKISYCKRVITSLSYVSSTVKVSKDVKYFEMFAIDATSLSRYLSNTMSSLKDCQYVKRILDTLKQGPTFCLSPNPFVLQGKK